ncbi:MAG TPA: hypothetical protein RMG45_16380, partial [Polyangiaceae bacterium LLY-WYZ-15_(1-7)]|nr:hypothetical protein [Polyangiaceae bacterium LLY-WYZ-15_(1-7)]
QHVHEVADREGARAFLARYGAAPGESISLLGVAGGYSTLSLFTEPDLAQVGVLTGTVPAAGAPSGLGLLERFVEAQPWIGARVFGGQAGIPIRRPYARLAAPGVALLGDAGCMVYASHGSGVGMGLIAARMLAEALRGAADPGSARALRRWERSWQRRWGGRLAGADAFRRFAQGLDREGVATLFGSGLLDPHLVEAGLRQQPPALDPAWLVRAAKRLAQRPDVARRMLPAVARSLALEPLLALAPVDQVEPVVERLVGPTPKTRARVHLP